MNQVVVKQEATSGVGESKALARRMATAYRERVARYKAEQGLTTQQAVAKADEPCALDRVWALEDAAPEDVTWGGLQELVGETGQRSAGRWEEIKQAAREELRSGHRAGGAVLDRHARPFELARFLAIREELAEEWRPRNGVERQLIDQMAQAQFAVFLWLE